METIEVRYHHHFLLVNDKFYQWFFSISVFSGLNMFPFPPTSTHLHHNIKPPSMDTLSVEKDSSLGKWKFFFCENDFLFIQVVKIRRIEKNEIIKLIMNLLHHQMIISNVQWMHLWFGLEKNDEKFSKLVPICIIQVLVKS